MSILEILNQLEAEASTNNKLKILESHKDEPLFSQVVSLALNPFIKFGIKKIPEYKEIMHPIGDYSIKHGEKLNIFNIYGDG